MRFSHHPKGSAIVETLVSTTALVIFISGGINLSYLTFANIWLGRAAYEAIVCLSTSARKDECERRLRQSTVSALPIGEISMLHLHRDSRKARVRLRFRILGRDVVLHEDQRSLPLRPGGRT